MKQLVLIITIIAFTSCNKCKSCYLIEETNNGTNEFYEGTFCGDELDEKENQEAYCPQTTCTYECR